MRFLKNTEMKGWLLFTLILLGSFYWRDLRVTAGVFTGGMIALLDFRFMRVLIVKIVLEGNGVILLLIQLLKYLMIASVLAFLYLFNFINPIASLVGLSLLVVMPLVQLPALGQGMKEVH